MSPVPDLKSKLEKNFFHSWTWYEVFQDFLLSKERPLFGAFNPFSLADIIRNQYMW